MHTGEEGPLEMISFAHKLECISIVADQSSLKNTMIQVKEMGWDQAEMCHTNA